jgi:hypothetical protein
MVVLGADPDVEQTEWVEDDSPRVSRSTSPQVYSLMSHFMYHPQMKMSQRMDDTDRAILARLFSRRLKQGYTVDSLKQMVDRFYFSWAGDTDRPAMTFASTKVQEQLITEAELVKDDPVLMWLLDGMPNVGPFEDPKQMRKHVLLHAQDAMLSYPEVVADILREGKGVSVMLETLGYLVSNQPQRDSKNVALLQSVASVPEELLSSRSNARRRPKRATVGQAIANIPKVLT